MEPKQPLTSLDPATSDSLDRPSHSEDGVDLTLIRWMLSLTPVERLKVLQQHNLALAKLRDDNPHLRFPGHSPDLPCAFLTTCTFIRTTAEKTRRLSNKELAMP